MMPSNLHQLYTFHMVATLGSFSKAAKELSISQPAVSIQVRDLEKSIGSALFKRMRRGPELTDVGGSVFSYTKQIFSLVEEMQRALHEVQGLRSGRLSIGSSTTPGEYILPWVIGQFQRRYPGVQVSLSISNTQTVVERIRDRELDLGMAGATVNLQGLVSFPYVTDQIVVIGSPSHTLAAAPKISVSDLEGQEFVMREPGSATRSIAETCLAEHGVSIRVATELGSNEAVKQAVATGLGLGVMSRFGIASDVIAGFLRPLDVDGWRCERPLIVFHRGDRSLPAAQQAFLCFLQSERPLPDALTGMAWGR